MNYSLKKRGKHYHYYFRINKKRFRGSTDTETKEYAKKFVESLYKQHYFNKYKISNAKTRIDEFIDYHLENTQINISKDWHYTKTCLLKMFFNYIQEKNLNYLDEIEFSHVEAYKAKLLKSSKPKTAKNNLMVVSTLLNHAVKLGHIQENPVKELDPIRQIQKNKKRFLSKDEIKIVLNAVKDTCLFDLVRCGIYTGMRRGELINLEFEDVDYKGKLIYVRNKEEFQTKSRKERVLPIHQKLFTFFKGKKKGYYFTNDKGEQFKKQFVTVKFVEIANSLKLKDVSLHTLRHTFISHALMMGITPWEVGKWVGHSSVYITELYGHLCPNRREIDKIDF